MREGRKRAVSVRVSTADLRKVKLLAERLGTRDSDVIRYALRVLLARLAPLQDKNIHGRALLPVFMEADSDFFHFFDLDSARLDEIVNQGVMQAQRVETDDLKLIALAGKQPMTFASVPPVKGGRASQSRGGDEQSPGGHLRGYLYSKYSHADEEPNSDSAND